MNGFETRQTPAKEPHPIDCHVGARVRLRRTLVGMSQEQLGASLGLTFQQIQKYERGTNRISASRLWQIGRVLSVPIDFFYDGAIVDDPKSRDTAASSPQSEITGLVQSTESVQLLRYFTQIGDPKLRRAVADLAKALAGTEESRQPAPT